MNSKRWIYFMLAMLGVATAPVVVNDMWTISGWNQPEYREDILSGIAFSAVVISPAVILGILAVWTNRTRRGMPIVTIGCLVYSLAAALGYALMFTSDSSTAGVVFIPVTVVQMLATIVCGVIVIANHSLADAL